ncbi:MAG: DUF4852 domain-containing protein [Alphaproteobacteria bacterium]|nr:DUF4852 domain-containing protein [Alphaproteobacteria bacterium]
MRLRLFTAAFFACCLAAGSARADIYAKPSWQNLMKTMVRFNALDLSDTKLLDQYAIITECDLYKAYYNNDFKWEEVRHAIVNSIRKNIATYPIAYQYDTRLQLDRYDFASKLFRFTKKSTINNINSFDIYSVEGTGCGTASVTLLPRDFHAVLADPIYMQGLPLDEKDAEALLNQMTKDGNINRIIFVRFNLRIVYIDHMRKVALPGEVVHYEQSNAPNASWIRMDARLDSIDFYEDPQMTRLIYEFTL